MKNIEKENFKKEFKKRVYNFSLDVIKCIDDLPQGQTSLVIGNQLLRSATSIGANVVEARGASSKKDFANFFHYALKSANETKYWLGLLRDSGKLERKKSNTLLEETQEIANILARSILTMKEK